MKKEKTTKKKEEDVVEKPRRKRPGPPNKRPSSRRHRKNREKVEKSKMYTQHDALSLLKNCKSAKFDETVEVVMNLGIDPRKSDQLVRGSVSLPKGTGKEVCVLVFAEGELAEQAKDAGADYVGGQDLVDKIMKENWVDYDLVIAHPSMMRFVGRLGKILGPKGKMPSPKAGTVTIDVVKAVEEFKSGRVEYRSDSGGNVHAPIGKKSFSVEDLAANLNAFVEHIKGVKPSASKGTYIQKIVVSSTMGPGVHIELKK